MTIVSLVAICCLILRLATQCVSSRVLRSDTTKPLMWKLPLTLPWSRHCTAVDTRPRILSLLPAKENLRHCRSVTLRPSDFTKS